MRLEKNMCIISITGSTGNMGSEVLKAFFKEEKYELRLLLKKSKKNSKLAHKLSAKYKNVKIFFGSLSEYETLLNFVKDASYCIHLAALIPPHSDYNEKETIETNYLGTQNLVNAVVETGGAETCHFIHIGSVAQYGNRTSLHPFGRVGDPLLPSVFDVYATSKVKAERVVIESPLRFWASLRQTGVLYDDILFKNMNDGLMFHTPLNCPIEWVTAKDSAILIKNLVEATEEGKLKDFYKKVYNIGGGLKMRTTGFETLDEGFRLMGCSVKDVFLPEWIAKRNFHCMWFSDSNVLEELFHFQKTSFRDFFDRLKVKFWYFRLAKPFLFLVKLFAIKPLLKNKNAPMYWKKNDEERWKVFSNPDSDSLNENWEDVKLLCKNIDEKTNSQVDYEALKNGIEIRKLDHGYDESKPDSELDIEDVRKAANFRGGKVLSASMKKGDLYTKIDWACHEGHVFSATPYLVLKTGHWCPECSSPPWNFGKQVKHNPFYAQLYYDDHKENEDACYDVKSL